MLRSESAKVSAGVSPFQRDIGVSISIAKQAVVRRDVIGAGVYAGLQRELPPGLSAR